MERDNVPLVPGRMNSLGAGTLDTVMRGQMVRDVAALLHDTQTGVTVNFEVPGARVFDPTTGAVTYATTWTPVTAWLSDVALMSRPPVEAQVGDIQVLVAYGDLAELPGTAGRFIVPSGDRAGSYAIYQSGAGPLDTHYALLGHKVN